MTSQRCAWLKSQLVKAIADIFKPIVPLQIQETTKPVFWHCTVSNAYFLLGSLCMLA